MFDLSLSVGELIVRAAAVYFVLFVLLRFIGKKHVGGLKRAPTRRPTPPNN